MTWAHGTVTGYRANACRCEPCTAAHRDRRQQERITHNEDRRRCRCATCATRRRTLRVADAEARAADRRQKTEAAREASTVRRIADAAARRAAFLANLDDPRHGRRFGHTYYGCNCDRCRGAHLDYMRARNRQKRGAA